MCGGWSFSFTSVIAIMLSLTSAQYTKDCKDSKLLSNVTLLDKALEMRSYMKDDLDPCDNFYEFACGNWARLYPARINKRTSATKPIIESFKCKIKDLLEGNTDVVDSKVFSNIRDFYASCKYAVSEKNPNSTKFMEIIDEYGGMPAIKGSQWHEDSFDWVETIAKIAHIYNLNIVLELTVSADFLNNTVNSVSIRPQTFALRSRPMYLDTANAQHREELKNKISKKLQKYLELNEELANQTAQEIVDFETALAKGLIDDDAEDLENDELYFLGIYASTNVSKLQQSYGDLMDMEKLFSIRFGEKILEPIYAYREQYMKNLYELIKITPKRIVANYIMFKLFDAFLQPTEDTEIENIEKCLEKTENNFKKIISNMVYQHFITEKHNKTRQMHHMWEGIKETFRTSLLSKQIGWMSDNVRQLAIEKLNAMQLEISTYEKHNLSEELDELVFVNNDYIGNIKRLYEYQGQREIKKLHEKPTPDYANTFSPSYNRIKNLIYWPVSWLQFDSIWDTRFPNALVYSTMGAIIGHEMIHGFDREGRKFNAEGNLINWWDKASTDAFGNRTQCLINQYGNFNTSVEQFPSRRTLSENIGDNGGLRIAYQTFLQELQQTMHQPQSAHEKILPPLNFTEKQLFFISYAQLNCGDIVQYDLLKLVSTDVHSPGAFRVNGPLSNIPEFAKEFSCVSNTNMNRSNKCTIY